MNSFQKKVSMDAPKQNKSFILKTLESIGGVGGIVAGLSVVIAACGYLSLKANANLLGFSHFVNS